jgi:DNA-binding transcriptional MerR regulator
MTTADIARYQPDQPAALPALLTIGQLADYVGVTVRAIRHYHQRGLIPEPERDASGYRRYDANAVIDLIRIKALADAGIPLARIRELLAAAPEEFAGAVAGIDAELAGRIREIRAQRRRIAQLASGDRLFVPAEIADVLERIRALGVSAQEMKIERDSWILLAARYPAQASYWAQLKLAALADPEFQRLYRAYYAAYGWAADDPRLDDIAEAIVDYSGLHRAETQRHHADSGQLSSAPPVDDPVAMALVHSRTDAIPPAWARLDQLCQEKAGARGPAAQ